MHRKGFVSIIVAVIGIIILAGVAGYFIVNYQTFFQKPAKEINTFEECAKAGYPVGESYPRQCWTPDNRRFVEEVPPTAAGLKIITPKGGGIYLGAHNQNQEQGRKGVAEFENAVGKKVAIFPAGMGSSCKDGGTEGTLPKIDIQCREKLWQQGYVSTFGIEVPPGKRAFSNEDIAAGKIDNELKQVARDIANWGKPIFWLYQREPGAQFPILPSTNEEDKPQLYKAVHRRIHDVVEQEIKAIGKQSPITWVMGGIIESFLDGFYTKYYPGDAYVDWHAFDWYAAASCPYTSISKSYGWQEAMKLNANKPVILIEFGVTKKSDETDCPQTLTERSAWYQAFFRDVRTNPAMKNLAAFLYWQSPPGNTQLIPGDSEAKTWQQEIKAHPNFWHSQVQTGGGTSGGAVPPPHVVGSLLKVCPKEWIINKMPTFVPESNSVPNEYFIYGGKRRELSEFDVNWVKQNCAVQPSEVW